VGKSKYSYYICPKFYFTLTVISLESVWNACSADVCEWFLALDWIIHQRVLWEQNIRDIYLPSLQLSIIMWLSHLLTSFSSQRNRYLLPKYRVANIWAERFRYGYTPWPSDEKNQKHWFLWCNMILKNTTNDIVSPFFEFKMKQDFCF
jgi:hypothetical protein